MESPGGQLGQGASLGGALHRPGFVAKGLSEVELTWRLTTAALGRFSADRLFGLWWWVVDPLVMIAVYALIFATVFELVGRDVAATYPLFLACGLIPWRWFTVATTRGANAFLANAGLLTSTPVSRRAVVWSELLASTLEALVGFVVLLVFMLAYGRDVTWNLLWLPVPFAIMGALTVGVSLVLCPLTVMIRDLGNMFSALLRAAWFLSPGLYGLDHIPEGWRGTFAALNPFVGLLEGIRRPIHDASAPLWVPLLWSVVWAILLLAAGRWVFRRFGNEAVRLL